MADALIIPTTATATALDSDGETYTPDAWGRFALPGSLAESLLATGGWKVWEPADAPALGEWVDMGVPTLADAEADDLFPCWVQLEGISPDPAAPGFRYRTVGASQVQLDGVVAYVVGTNLPTDFGTPPQYSQICPFPTTFTLVPSNYLSVTAQGFNPVGGQPSLGQVAVGDGHLLIIGPADEETFPLASGIGMRGTCDAL